MDCWLNFSSNCCLWRTVQKCCDVLLLFWITTKSNSDQWCHPQVFSRAVQRLVFELQASMGVSAELSPPWITAAAKFFAARMDTLSHIFLLQPHLAADVLQQCCRRTQPQAIVRLVFYPAIFWTHRAAGANPALVSPELVTSLLQGLSVIQVPEIFAAHLWNNRSLKME